MQPRFDRRLTRALALTSPRTRGPRAFTLVELLVVVGLIALLIGILMPALRRARESAKAVQCLSNIRQLSSATVMFAQERKGWMPAAGASDIHLFHPVTGKPVTFVSVYNIPDGDPLWRQLSMADWISWQRRGQDPVKPQVNQCPSLNITQSGLAPYLGIKRVYHTTDAEAHTVSALADGIFRCPSDRPEAHFLSGQDASRGSYLYSYSMNSFYAGPVSGKGRRVVDGTFTGRISSIRNAAQKILFVCEDEKTIDNGGYSPDTFTWFSPTNGGSLVASRHESRMKRAASRTVAEFSEESRGNVGFCDGHAEVFSRKDALRAKYTGNPTPDAPNFK